MWWNLLGALLLTLTVSVNLRYFRMRRKGGRPVFLVTGLVLCITISAIWWILQTI